MRRPLSFASTRVEVLYALSFLVSDLFDTSN